MPRETISQVDRTGVPSRVHVGWSNHHEDVQVGVELPSKPFKFIDKTDKTKYTSLWTVNLTEIELNQVISALQKARRRTFHHKRKIDE